MIAAPQLYSTSNQGVVGVDIIIFIIIEALSDKTYFNKINIARPRIEKMQNQKITTRWMSDYSLLSAL